MLKIYFIVYCVCFHTCTLMLTILIPKCHPVLQTNRDDVGLRFTHNEEISLTLKKIKMAVLLSQQHFSNNRYIYYTLLKLLKFIIPHPLKHVRTANHDLLKAYR